MVIKRYIAEKFEYNTVKEPVRRLTQGGVNRFGLLKPAGHIDKQLKMLCAV